MLTICKDSHLDHGLTMEQLRWILEQVGDRSGFFIETLEMPGELGGLSCALYGPLRGDKPVRETEVHYKPRNGREWPSRLCMKASRLTTTVTVVAGPHAGLDCVLFTVYGGPAAPREPGDPSLSDEERSESEKFWADHALSYMAG